MRTALLVLSLAGCTTLPASPQYDVTLHIVETQAEVERECGKPLVGTVLGCQKGTCTIVAMRPRSFEDHRRLETLGHELWHCAGNHH